MTKRSPHPALLVAIVAVAALLVYANALANGFALDDVYIIQRNPRVHDLSNLRDIWLTPYWPWSGRELGLYRPGTIFLYAVQWAIGDGAPRVFHVMNLLLHALASVLVFVLLRRLVSDIPALAGALIFAVHPVHAEAVANVVGQAEIVAAIAVLAACLVHTGRPPGIDVSWPRRLVMLALFMVALSTKESAVVLPALLIVLDFVQGRVRLTVDGFARYAGAMLMPIFLFAAALAAYLLVRMDVMGGALIGVDANPAMPYLREEHRILNALRAFPEFLRLLFFPQELAADYLPNVIMPVDDVRPMVVLGAALLAGITILALLTPWLPAAGFPAAWFLITIITVSNLFFPIGVLVAERTLYLPSVAVAAMVAFAWRAAAAHASRPMRVAASAALLAAFMLFSMRTWIRNPDWKDNPAVFGALVRDHPHSYRAQWVQATALRVQGHLDLADQHYRMAMRIYPRDSQVMAEYGNFLLAMGRFDEAVAMLEASRRQHPLVQTTLLALAYAFLANGQYDEALRTIGDAESLGAGQATTMPLRAYAYHGLGRVDQAVGASRVAMKHEGIAWWMSAYFARNLAIGGVPDEAANALEAARTDAPDEDARALLDRLEQAIAAGCYARPAADRTSCDPLVPAFELEVPAQNARGLQNATKGTDPTAESPS